MNDANKKDFWIMLNVAMELTNHPPLSKEAVIIWYNQLKQFEFNDVSNALDQWLKVSSKPPTPKDIIEACKPKPTIFARLPSPLAIAENHRHAVEVKQAVEKMTEGKRDMKAWARKIIANPKNYPEISLRYAREALGVVIDG